MRCLINEDRESTNVNALWNVINGDRVAARTLARVVADVPIVLPSTV